MTSELEWFFGAGGSEDQGPKDSIELLFKGNKYYSIAREAIQNSVDAVLDNTNPVVVKFSLFEIEKPELPHFFELKKTLERCLDKYMDDKYAQKILKNSIDAISGSKIKCLRISDYNTIGLEYNGDKSHSPFYAFMQAVGFNLKKSTGSGGSFGFGKGAYYAASAFKTIIISSIYDNDKFIFQGKARLTTHLDDNGNKKDYVGKFGAAEGSPIVSPLLIPEKLRRSEKGTDIIIMGFQEEGDWKESLIKSVLNNFWLAIWNKQLIVEVEGTIIDSENLETIINQFYTEDTKEGSVNEPETWNPYPYFKAVKYKGGPNNEYFTATLSTLGLVEMYLLKKEGLQNRTIYLRTPKMVVFKETKNKGVEYVAVFLCKNDAGNKILQQMENPQHNEWKKTNYLDNDRPHKEAVEAEKELKAFVNECLQKLLSSDSGSKQKFVGLEKYLSIPEDLLPETEGNGQAVGSGSVTDELSISETPVERTFNQSESEINVTVKKKTRLIQPELGDINESGDTLVFVGNNGNGEQPPGPPGPPLPPDDIPGPQPAIGITDGHKKIKKPLFITYRVISQKNSNGEIIHLLKIFASKNAFTNIELFAGVDNDSDREDGLLTITNATKDSTLLSVVGNKLNNVHLETGENIITLTFDSNQKHSLKIKSYEI